MYFSFQHFQGLQFVRPWSNCWDCCKANIGLGHIQLRKIRRHVLLKCPWNIYEHEVTPWAIGQTSIYLKELKPYNVFSDYNRINEMDNRKLSKYVANVCMLSCSVVSDSWQPHGLWPTRLLCPWDFPGKNTEVCFRALLQGIFLTQRLNPSILHLLNWQVDS